MARYAAFLRGVMPTNVRMPELRGCFEAAGLDDVKTLLASGNVVFTARAASSGTLERRIEAAMRDRLGRVFRPFVRAADVLEQRLRSDPYEGFRLGPKAKRIVTFLPTAPKERPKLPIELQGARILRVEGSEVFSAYLPNPRGPVFMSLIEKTFGTDLTTRTWDTVRKVAAALETLP